MLQKAAKGLDTLRRHRGVRAGPPTLGDEIKRQAAALGRQHRSLHGLGAAWGEVVPPEIGGTVQIQSLRRGVLTVKATDSAGAYVLDRWLRSGGLEALRARAATALARVKIVS
jgi:hypothetical protein